MDIFQRCYPSQTLRLQTLVFIFLFSSVLFIFDYIAVSGLPLYMVLVVARSHRIYHPGYNVVVDACIYNFTLCLHSNCKPQELKLLNTLFPFIEFFSCVVYVGIRIPPLYGGLLFCKLLPQKFPDKVKKCLLCNDRDTVRIHFSSS